MGTSQKEKENKALRALIANANQEDVDEEEIRKIVKNIAEKIVAAREKVQLKRKELRKKEKALMDAELENLRRATFDPPRAPLDLTSKIDIIDTVTISLEAKETYYYELVRRARRDHPKVFRRQQK